MKRKVTKLEENLTMIGFKLERKLYVGQNRDRVFGYVYTLSEIDGETYDRVTYEVTLDSKRNKISYYSFYTRNSTDNYYNHSRLEKLQAYMKWLEQILHEIYDFKTDSAKDYEDVSILEEFDEPFIEEHYFDED